MNMPESSSVGHSYTVHVLAGFLSGGIILGSPLFCPDQFLYTTTLPAVSCDAPSTPSYTPLEVASKSTLIIQETAHVYVNAIRTHWHYKYDTSREKIDLERNAERILIFE
jgi:hypothetical protein